MIRKANINDINKILEIYDYAHIIMKNDGNADQWPSYYPGLGHRMGILGCSTAEMKMSLGC